MRKTYNHPETCFVLLPTVNNTIGIVKWGESGYYKTNYPSGYTEEIVNELNDRLGCSRTEIKAMQICSMANLPETEDAWEKHFQMLCSMIDKYKRIKVWNIEWDTDGEIVDNLPTEIVIDNPTEEMCEAVGGFDDVLADYLSGEYGWCVFGFEADFC